MTSSESATHRGDRGAAAVSIAVSRTAAAVAASTAAVTVSVLT